MAYEIKLLAAAVVAACLPMATGCAGGGTKNCAVMCQQRDVIVDNSNADRFKAVGEWASENGEDGYSYGADALWAPKLEAGKAPDTATWTPQLPCDGDYEVFVWYSADPKDDHSTVAPFVVVANGKKTTRQVNLKRNYGQWNSLGVYRMKQEGDNRVVAETTTTGNAIADAVKFVCVGK